MSNIVPQVGNAVNQQLCKVTYDRSAREYIVRNGREIARFPSGKTNKIKAQWCALDYDDATIAALARDLVAAGHDEKRAIRAARLVIEDKVHAGHVESQTHEGVVYSVSNRAFLGIHCECVDYENGREARFNERRNAPPTVDGQTGCKHALARLIVDKRDDDVTDAGRRKMADKIERRRAIDPEAPLTRRERFELDELRREQDETPWYLRPDPVNLRTPYYGFDANNINRYSR